MKRLLTLALILASGAVFAAAHTVTLTWTPSFQNTDGTTIPPTDVLTFNVYAGASGNEVKVASVTAATWTSSALVDGTTQCYQVTETDSTTSSGESARTNEICQAVPAGVPNAPSNVVIKLN